MSDAYSVSIIQTVKTLTALCTVFVKNNTEIYVESNVSCIHMERTEWFVVGGWEIQTVNVPWTLILWALDCLKTLVNYKN